MPSELEQCCELVMQAGLATGPAESHIELMQEVLAQCINAGPNVVKQTQELMALTAKYEHEINKASKLAVTVVEQAQEIAKLQLQLVDASTKWCEKCGMCNWLERVDCIEKRTDLEKENQTQAQEIERLKGEREGLIQLSQGLSEHPEDYDGPCECYECRLAGA